MNFAVDTHALAWWLDQDAKLSRTAKSALEDNNGVLLVPTMVLVELEYMGRKRGVANYLRDKFNYLEDSRDVRILPLDREAALAVNTHLNVHDAIIVATALSYSARRREAVMVVTKDGPIHKSGLVEVVW